MLDAKLSPIGWFLVAAVVAAGCIDPHCPKGYVKKEDRCYRIKDGGTGDASLAELDAGGGVHDASEDAHHGDAEVPDIDAGDADAQEPPAEYALGQEGAACGSELEQTLACEGHAGTKVLKCEQGIWKMAQTCNANERCDSRPGTEQGKCAPIPAACLDKAAGDVCDGTVRLTCGIDLVTVTPNPCPDHAHCAATSAVRCECDLGWRDRGEGTCTNEEDCPPNACVGGTCVDGLDDYTCDCGDGYAGTGTKACMKVDYCPKDACTPGGTCVDQPDWSCQCDQGFSGTGTKACTNINDCVAGACSPPGGSCEDGVNTFSCECHPGYSGENCENDICNPNPCRNGGTCARTGTLCVCPTGFSGVNCQIDACSPNPCQHGGSCSRIAQGASCDCAGTGYTGTKCEAEVNECASNNSCTNEVYPCVQTTPPGYTCQGLLADWPMPDAVVGSKTKPSYSASGFVVVDNVTGLAWQQYPPSTFAPKDCAESDGCTLEEAKAYCDKLVIGGYDDFRVPTKIELESILDDTRGSPTIDPVAFPNADGRSYWTASPMVGIPDRAWIVVFSSGTPFGNAVTGRANVRCVQAARKLPALSMPRYTAGSSATIATVTDARTGLVWQQVLNTTTRDMAAAKAYCASLGAGWRLPTKKELLTLVDPTVPFGGSVPAIDPIFAGTPADASFWSSTASANATGRSWLVSSSGVSTTNDDTTQAYVRCAR